MNNRRERILIEKEIARLELLKEADELDEKSLKQLKNLILLLKMLEEEDAG